MRHPTPAQIWTITGAAFMHGWAALELFEWTPAVISFVNSISHGVVSVSSGLVLFQGISNDVGLLVICAVAAADCWILATSARWSEDKRPERAEVTSEVSKGIGFRWRRLAVVLVLVVVLGSITFCLGDPGRMIFVACVVTVTVAISAFLLYLRVDASSRVLEQITATDRHLNSAAAHLDEIKAFANRNASLT